MRPPPRRPTLAQQGVRLKQGQPDSAFRIDQRGCRLVWIGWLQPTPASERYRVRIEAFRSTKISPKVYVESPALFERNGELVPHLYSVRRAQLCLWRPGKSEWSPCMWLVDSVLLWASLWLFFYEVWLATGDWLGGGEHPEVND